MEKGAIVSALVFLGIVTLPVKIVMEFVNPGLLKSTVFAAVFGICILLMAIFSSKLVLKNDIKYSSKNVVLAFLSAVCCLGILWSAIAHFSVPSPSDVQFQYWLFNFFCLLSSLFFAGVSYSHLSGNNVFRKMQFIVFSPILMYITSLTVFFTFEFDDPSAYEVLGQSLMLLFFVYYSHFYIKLSEKNYLKRCFAFGVPAVVVNLCHYIPRLVTNPVGSVNSVSSISSILICAYVSLFLVSEMKFMDLPEKVGTI